MPYYRQAGDVPRKRHTYMSAPGGGYRFEELVGQHGFSGESSLLYHACSPSAIVGVEALDDPVAVPAVPDRPLAPRHIRTTDVACGDDVVLGRSVLFANDDVRVAFARATVASELYRDARGDQLAFVHDGRARVESSFGTLEVTAGDYVVVPSSVTHRWVPDGRVDLLIVEAAGHVGIPAKYLSPRGQLREGAPFSERDLRGPDITSVHEGADVPVLVRNHGGLTRLVHAHHPFDVVGWDGCVYPFAFSIADFEPIVGARHQPPPVHQTFEGPGLVVCSFVPRPFDFGSDAVKVPYHHANTDSDEVLFYVAGDFMSRAGSGIGVGSISYHPAGFVHGPQPGSVEGSRDAARTDETAVMLDTFRPLSLTEAARRASDPDYALTWVRPAD